MTTQQGGSAQAPIQVFLSYARKDQKLVVGVREQLAVFEHRQEIAVWWDGELDPGTEWDGEITKRLETAQIVLLFVSPAFFSSTYCYTGEMPQALRQREAGTSTVIPVITRPCDWEAAPFAGLQVLPENGTPLWNLRNYDAGCLQVAQGVMDVVRKLRGQPALSRKKAGGPRTRKASPASTDQSYDSPVDFVASLPQRVRARLGPLMSADKHDWANDHTGDYFGNEKAIANGRRLQAKIVEDHEDALDIELRVTRVSGKPLDGPVLFLKHQTYGTDRVELVEPIGDLAKTVIQTEGWFTVAAIADRGKTILAYSLKRLKAAPDWFVDQ